MNAKRTIDSADAVPVSSRRTETGSNSDID